MVRQTRPGDTLANLIPHLPWSWGPRLSVLCRVEHLQHSTSPPTARVRLGHTQANAAGLTSPCSQQGWGLASSATQSFQKPWGTSHQRGRRCLGTILRRRSGLAVQGHLGMWMWAQNNPQIPANRWCTHYLHMCIHPSWTDRVRPETPKGHPEGGQVPTQMLPFYCCAHHRLFSGWCPPPYTLTSLTSYLDFCCSYLTLKQDLIEPSLASNQCVAQDDPNYAPFWDYRCAPACLVLHSAGIRPTQGFTQAGQAFL